MKETLRRRITVTSSLNEISRGSEAESKEKLGVWDPMPELTVARVDSITFTMGNPMPESTLTLFQSRL
jgi:hypothetical protein